ncbi:MAG: DUF6504 family protein [Phycisphaerae bacterium]
MPDPQLPPGEFISEPVIPCGAVDTAAMARGEPGLPAAFEWRGDRFEIVEVLGAWKESSREGGRATGELYLRRHYYRLRVSDGTIWQVYFVRQAPRTGSPRRRWFLERRST